MKNYAIIMAGGSGTRFWPVSRKSNPKQFQKIGSSDTLLNDTIHRIAKTLPMENIYIVASKEHQVLLYNTLPEDFSKHNLLFEPMARNTAAAVACSVQYLHSQFGDVNVGVFPADHHIDNTEEFSRVITSAYDTANNQEGIVTLGIPATFPSTGYGYLKVSQNTLSNTVQELDQFVEKPDYDKAVAYLNSSNYYWNAGIVFARSSYLLDKIKEHMPALNLYSSQITNWHQKLQTGELETMYGLMPATSIDYGVLEKCQDLFMIVLDAGWNDLGSWDVISDLFPKDTEGNVTDADHILMDASNSYILSSKKFVAAIGIDDLIIVDTEDSLLICKKDHVQDIKKLVDTLKTQGRVELL